MALAVENVASDMTIGAGATSGAFTSVSGSLIVVIGFNYNGSFAAAGSDVTDSKGNSYTLIAGSDQDGSAQVGHAVYYNNGGTRGAGHTVSYATAAEFEQMVVIEITGHDSGDPIDESTLAVANDATSAYSVTAAGAISGNQIALYGCALDSTGNTAWTQPTGYTNIGNQPNANAHIACIGSYKINETGTPTVGASSSHTVSAGRQVFVTVKEAAAGGGATAKKLAAQGVG